MTRWGERLSPSERLVLDGQPQISGEDTGQNRLKVHETILNSPKGSLNPNDRAEIRLMMDKEYTLHNLDPKCQHCIKCEMCYFPNRIRSCVNEGRLEVFLKDVEVLPTSDSKKEFQCKFIFNDKLKMLEGN